MPRIYEPVNKTVLTFQCLSCGKKFSRETDKYYLERPGVTAQCRRKDSFSLLAVWHKCGRNRFGTAVMTGIRYVRRKCP
jgi:hypothetical protein